jgi:hypothetical protein
MLPFLEKLIYNTHTAALANRYYDQKLKNLKNYIFVATTGRSGTRTLAYIFNKLDNCIALHEPYPTMHDDILHATAYGDDERVQAYYKIRKSVNIRRNAVGSEYYVEANHLFIKTFIGHAIADFKDRTKVIHLVRSAVDVANSIYTLEDQPGTIEGNTWWLDYRAPTNLIDIASTLDDHKEFKHPYYKALWYWFETEARIAHWKQKLPQVPFILFNTESFNNKTSLSLLFEQLSIDIPEGFVSQVVNQRVHVRAHHKKRPPLPEEQTRKMLSRFVDFLKEINIGIPETANE